MLVFVTGREEKIASCLSAILKRLVLWSTFFVRGKLSSNLLVPKPGNQTVLVAGETDWTRCL
jgi:hypothetical protein